MKENKENNDKITFLDGSPEEQKKAVEKFLGSMSNEEHERAMLDEFAYLDEAYPPVTSDLNAERRLISRLVTVGNGL